MRQPRFTYPGASHHCTNRGIEGVPILAGTEKKRVFIDLLAEKVVKFRMRLFAFCLMDNHYHLVLQNASGRMSDFFRNLNTQYANFFRKVVGGQGYVFQSRFHSTIIEDDEYLKLAIIYVLQNPLRAGLTDDYSEYPWSSSRLNTGKTKYDWLDSEYVRALFGGGDSFDKAVQAEPRKRLPLLHTPFGWVLGDRGFIKKALERFERRHLPNAIKRRRWDDLGFDTVEKVIWEFEQKYRLKINDLATGHHEGKRQRGELLVRLRDLAGLTLRQISEFDIFSGIKYRSLPHLYRNAKIRLKRSK